MKYFNRCGQPSWFVSLLPFLFLLATLALVIYVFGTDALSGGSQVALMLSAAFTVVLAMLLYNISWKTFEDAIPQDAKAIGTAGVKKTGRNNEKIEHKIEVKIMGYPDRLFSSKNNYYFDIYSDIGLH